MFRSLLISRTVTGGSESKRGSARAAADGWFQLTSLPQSPVPPLAVGFTGLGTSYLIYGPQGLFGFPRRNEPADFGTGIWGSWMPGFMQQLITGLYLFAGLTLFGTLKTPALYMAALAFTAVSRLRRTRSTPCCRSASASTSAAPDRDRPVGLPRPRRRPAADRRRTQP
ncbi:MAG TPA: hypothetical protein VGD91_22585 [Trebonia sp.]